jgi:light-regulated signal transduction histidine kinase (bacteriophytochrome)
LSRVRSATQRMGILIDDLLGLARITKARVQRKPVDLTDLARSVLAEIEARDPGRKVEACIADGLKVEADPGLVTVLLENLLGNAWKFTGKRSEPRIEVGEQQQGDKRIFFVRDNGAGFDMEHAGRLFAPFQRMHREAEFPGTGIGLATVQRIVSRHEGRIWAEAATGRGTTFFFTFGGAQ